MNAAPAAPAAEAAREASRPAATPSRIGTNAVTYRIGVEEKGGEDVSAPALSSVWIAEAAGSSPTNAIERLLDGAPGIEVLDQNALDSVRQKDEQGERIPWQAVAVRSFLELPSQARKTRSFG